MNAFEIDILKAINSYISCDFLDGVFIFISTIGNKGAVWIAIAIGLLFFKKTRKWGVCASIALILCLVVGNGILKPVIHRIRPYDVDTGLNIIIPLLDDASFPSGHTLAAFAFASAVSRYSRKCLPYLYTAASLMAISRIYLMVHYPTDVLGGIVIGIIFGGLAYKITERYWKVTD